MRRPTWNFQQSDEAKLIASFDAPGAARQWQWPFARSGPRESGGMSRSTGFILGSRLTTRHQTDLANLIRN
jgi:hypothetical protein